MIPVPSPVEGVTIEHDLGSARWRLHAGVAAVTLRPWTWGERRRLLRASTANGTFDRTVFVHGLFDLLLDDPLPQLEPTSLVFTCLYLLGVSEDGHVLPLTRAELLAATTFGWPPQQIDAQPADDIDRLLAQLEPPAMVDDAWTRIVIVPEASSSIEERLESMLRTIARLAGVVDVVTDKAAPAVAARELPVATTPANQREEERREPPVERSPSVEPPG